MCEPTTLLVIGLAVTAAAGAAEASAQRKAGKANAAIAENNARLSEHQAKDEAILNAREQQQAAWRTRALIGDQRAAIAGNMIDPTSGTAFDLVGESALFGGADQSAISQEGARRAWAHTSQALNFRNEGAQAEWMGKTQSKITILRTIGSMASMGASAYGSGAVGGGAKGANSFTSSVGTGYNKAGSVSKTFIKG